MVWAKNNIISIIGQREKQNHNLINSMLDFLLSNIYPLHTNPLFMSIISLKSFNKSSESMSESLFIIDYLLLLIANNLYAVLLNNF